MAIRKTITELAKEQKKKGWGQGLKEWVISPGGVVTILLFLGVLWYVNHKTEKKA